MTAKTCDTRKQTAPVLRTIVILLCCAGAVGGIGCVTAFVTDSHNHRGNPAANAHFNTPLMTDAVFAVGRPDAALAKKIGQEDAIAFLGKKHSYLLVEGGKRLSDIAQGGLDGNKLILESTPRQLFLKHKTIWGNVSLQYAPGAGTADAISDISKLQTLGFAVDPKGVYRLTVPVKGVVCSRVQLKQELPDAFKKARDIAFYNPPDSTPPPDFGSLAILVKLPLAIAADVALTPVYLGILLVVITAN